MHFQFDYKMRPVDWKRFTNCSGTCFVSVKPTESSNSSAMNFKLIFLVALVLMAAFLGQTEGRRFKKFLKKVVCTGIGGSVGDLLSTSSHRWLMHYTSPLQEGAGRRVANAAQKGLPLAAGVKGLVG